jgi:NAD+ kinase
MNTQRVSRVGIVAKLGLPNAVPHLRQTVGWLDARGIEPVIEERTAELAGLGPERPRHSRDDLPHFSDLLLVLGGDGTLLGMAHRIAQCNRDIPILGVNFGHLGFLTSHVWSEVFASLEAAIAGTAPIDARLMLAARVNRGESAIAQRFALNDVVISRGTLSRMVQMSAWVGGEFVASFHADGLIVSSATGSTAYNLSAGGPIVHPLVDALVLTPIAPHMLSNRPVVIPASAEVRVRPSMTEDGQEAFLSLDGQSGLTLQPGDAVDIRRHDWPVRLIDPPSHGYFDVLRSKLKWAER